VTVISTHAPSHSGFALGDLEFRQPEDFRIRVVHRACIVLSAIFI